MANQRAPGQTLVGFWAEEALTEKIDEARGGTPRSQWLRDAIAEFLIMQGFKITTREKSAPDRKGKGGPAKHPSLRGRSAAMNDKISSAQKSPEEQFVDEIEAEADRALAKAAARKLIKPPKQPGASPRSKKRTSS